MVDTITMSLYIIIGLIVILSSLLAFKRVKNIIKAKRPYIKTPKFRTRSILIDDEGFGKAVAVGLEKTSPNEGFIHLVSQSGIVFKQHYSKFQIEPVDILENVAGSERPVFRVKGRPSNLTPSNMIDEEKRIIELADEIKKKDIDKKIAINEAATLKDVVLDIIKEVRETPKVETKVSQK